MATTPSGEYRLCCLAKHPESTYCNEEGEPLRLDITPLAEARNSAIAKDIRKTMLEGEWHPVCKKCFREEEAGLKSRRVFYREMESDKNFTETIKEKTLADGSIKHEDFPLETFDIRIGNLCNLKCRMCGPVYSTKWYADYQKMTQEDYFYNSGQKVFFSNAEDLRRFQWHESDFFWNEVLKNGIQIKHIYLIGGEPLIIKNQIAFLRRLVEEGFSKNIEIEYNSNMTVLPDDLIPIWKEFKKVTVGISVDSIFAENDYIRHPSKFDVIVKNINTLDSHVSHNFRIWLTTTFQVLNVFSLPKMIDWVESSNFEFVNKFPHSPLLHMHPAHGPLYYNVQCLPAEAKQSAKLKLQKKILDLDIKFQATGMKKYDKTARKLESIINFMFNKDQGQYLTQFFDITRKLDAIRKENFASTFPELAQEIGYEKSALIDILV